MGTPGAMPPPANAGQRSRAVRLALASIRAWALLGGLLILLVAVMTAVSAVSNLLLGRPLAADHELTKHLVAIAIFTFLPYCQVTGANVTVDIFTESMGVRSKALMAAFSALFAIVFSVVLLRQMSLGFQSYVQYPEVTPVLRLPLWTAFPPILVSLGLLLVAALITFGDGLREARGTGPAPSGTP